MKSSTRRGWVLLSVFLAGTWIVSSATAQTLAVPKANLDQMRNGTAASPVTPGAWVNGNLGAAQSHYLEGYSSPYRVVMEDLTIGSPVTIELGYDVKNSSRHALDYLTQYDRIDDPLHTASFTPSHSQEVIDPTIGVAGALSGPLTYAIPAPSSAGSPVPGQPTNDFNSLPANKRVMSLWNATFTGSTGGAVSNDCATGTGCVKYVTEGNLAGANSETTFRVTFTPTAATVILAYGGHIGSANIWGAGNSAGGISGSPYHMRLRGWSIGNLGQQDRSLSAGAVECYCCNTVCNDGSACTTDTCDEANNVCVYTPVTVGTSCEADTNLCTLDQCDANGVCVFSSNVSCPGSTGSCDNGTACTPATGFCDDLADPPLSTPCDRDGNQCTNDHCNGTGSCVFLSNVSCPGPTVPCDGGTACTPATGSCDPLPDPPLSTPCEGDGNFCTIDHCNGTGSCVFLSNVSCPGSTGPCDGGTSCTPATGACDPLPDPPLSTPCERDGNLCTIDHCNGSGTCVTFDSVTCPNPTGPCDGGSACNPSTGVCDPNPDAPLSTPCEADGNLCTIDHCNGAGSCVFLSNKSCPGPTEFCDGGTACTPATGNCDPLPDKVLSTSCEADGNLCTIDHCNGTGSCVTFNNVVCPGSTGTCDNGQNCAPSTGLCVFNPNPPPLSTPCEEDGNLCTIEHCDGNRHCVFLNNKSCPGPTGTCDGGTACTPATGACDPLPEPPLSTPCEADGNLCTIDHCNGAGSCVFRKDVVCSGPVGTCDGGKTCEPSSGTCVDAPEPPLSTPCEADGNSCTIDHCNGFGSCVTFDNVVCSGPTGTCDGGLRCTPATGACDPLPEPPFSTPCERDGNLCTIDHCDGLGSCVPLSDVSCPGPVGQCDNGTRCTPSTGQCDPLPPKPLSTSCERDGSLCTIDHCDGLGNCVLLSNVICPPPTEFCDGGTACTPSTGACDPLPELPLSTGCEADGDLCTIDHCDGLAHCVTFNHVLCSAPTEFCDAGKHCDPPTGACVDNPDPPLSTPCERDGNLCTDDHCNGLGSCVLLNTRQCPGSTGQCDTGTNCNPDTGGCVNNPDPPFSTPCEAEVPANLCTNDHCDGLGNCVFLSLVPCSGPAEFCDAGLRCTPATGACDPLPDPPLSTPCERDMDLCTIDHCNGEGSCVKLGNVICPGPTQFCDGGTRCTPTTGICDPLPDPVLSTPCEAEVPANLCTIDHCNGQGSCVHLSDVACPGPTQFCDAGKACTPATGLCDDLSDPPLSTPCEAESPDDPCSVDHCNGQGQCVELEQLCGACCDGNTGLCEDHLFPDQCFGDQREWFQARTCQDVISTGECQRHRGACCRTYPKESICTDGELPEECVGTNATWSKGETCDQVTCDIPVIPTMSSWGLTVLALILLVGAKLYFGRRPEVSAV